MLCGRRVSRAVPALMSQLFSTISRTSNRQQQHRRARPSPSIQPKRATLPHGRPQAPAAALRNAQAQEVTLLLAALCSAASEQRRTRRTHGVLSQPRGGGRPSEREPRGRPCPAHRRESGTKECKSRMLLRNGSSPVPWRLQFFCTLLACCRMRSSLSSLAPF